MSSAIENRKSTIANQTGARVLQLRMRADLRIEHQTYLGRHYWVVKDPLALLQERVNDPHPRTGQRLPLRVEVADVPVPVPACYL